MNFTQRIISMMERDRNVESNEARIAEETKTTECQLWRDHSRELSIVLQ